MSAFGAVNTPPSPLAAGSPCESYGRAARSVQPLECGRCCGVSWFACERRPKVSAPGRFMLCSKQLTGSGRTTAAGASSPSAPIPRRSSTRRARPRRSNPAHDILRGLVVSHRASPAAERPVVLRERRATIARLRRAWGRDHVCARPMLSRRRVAACRETINDLQSTADRAMVGGRGHGHCAAIIVTAPPS